MKSEQEQEEIRNVLYAFLVKEGLLFRYCELAKVPLNKHDFKYCASSDLSEGSDFEFVTCWEDTKEGFNYWVIVYENWLKQFRPLLQIQESKRENKAKV